MDRSRGFRAAILVKGGNRHQRASTAKAVALPDIPMTKRASLEPTSVILEQPDLIRYAAAAGDYNPIHYDTEAAKAAGLPGVVVHGMLNMALLAEYLEPWVESGYHVEDFQVRFRNFVRPGSPVVVVGKVKSETVEEVKIALQITAEGAPRPAVTGEALLRSPSP